MGTLTAAKLTEYNFCQINCIAVMRAGVNQHNPNGHQLPNGFCVRSHLERTKMKIIEFSSTDADRILGLSDQFLEDWAGSKKNDTDYIERRQEYDAIRPLLVAAPLLLTVLKKVYPGIELLPDGAFRMVKTFDSRRDWICVIRKSQDRDWIVEHNDSTDTHRYGDLTESLELALSLAPAEQSVANQQSSLSCNGRGSRAI